jgi:hypothetical protein
MDYTENWLHYRNQKIEIINNKYKEIDEKLKTCTDELEKQQLLEERAEYEEQSEELEEQAEYEEQSEELDELMDEQLVNQKVKPESIFVLLLKLLGEKIYIITTQQNYLYLLFIQFNCLALFQQFFTLSFSLLLTSFVLKFIEASTTKVYYTYININYINKTKFATIMKTKLQDYINVYYPKYKIFTMKQFMEKRKLK